VRKITTDDPVIKKLESQKRKLFCYFLLSLILTIPVVPVAISYCILQYFLFLFLVYILPQQPANFNGRTSFLAYQQMIDSTHEHDIVISFRSEQPNGMLFYAQGPPGVSDHLMISLRDSKVVCR